MRVEQVKKEKERVHIDFDLPDIYDDLFAQLQSILDARCCFASRYLDPSQSVFSNPNGN